jgi:DNA-binding transcriptional LysR family regulator
VAHPLVHVDVRRVPARQIGAAVAQGNLDFGVLTFQPAEPGLDGIVLGHDELVMLVHPGHPLAGDRQVALAECARQTVIAHNDPSHVRELVLRELEQHHVPANILVSLPSLEGIKRAVAMELGVALLPRRCAALEIARGELVALAIPEIPLTRQVRLVFRKAGERSHASAAFLQLLQADAGQTPEVRGTEVRSRRRTAGAPPSH